MKTEDLIRLNAASNGRLIVAMLFALNLMAGERALAIAAMLIVIVAWFSDFAMAAGKATLAGVIALIVLIWTAILTVVTCFAL